MKKLAFILLLLASGHAIAQRDNTFYVKQFAGADVGTKTVNAQAACNANMAIPCVIVFDPTLAVYAQGTMPAKCAQCIWQDFRTSGAQQSVIAEAYPGADIGAQINNAVASCVAAGTLCNIQVSKSGTISTPPDIPVGSSLTFNPTGSYTLTTQWTMSHRSTTYNFNGAHVSYAGSGNAFYVGKGISSVVNISGTTVTWVSGSQFNDIDTGDQIAVDRGVWGPSIANVAVVATPTSLILTGSPGTFTNAKMIVSMSNSAAGGALPGSGITVNGLTVDGSGASGAVALTSEFMDSLQLYNFTANNFTAGTCLSFKGTISANVYGTRCNTDKYGVILDQNAIGGFWVTTSNANRFFGLDIQGVPSASGSAITCTGCGGNAIYGLRLEGNQAHTGVTVQQAASIGYPATLIGAGGNYFQIADVERDGDNLSGSSDFSFLDTAANNVIEGPGSMTSTYTGSGVGLGSQVAVSFAATTANNVIRDESFIGYSNSYIYASGATGLVENVYPVGAWTDPTPSGGSYQTQPSWKAGISATQTITNQSYGSTDASGEDTLQFSWRNHGAARFGGYKESTNQTGFKWYCENGFNTPLLCGTLDHTGTLAVNAVNAGNILSGGTAGFTGIKTAGTCVLTIKTGIITNVTGC